jgi:hypothetical protein
MLKVTDATKKNETTLHDRLMNTPLEEMTDVELLAHAAGSCEWDPVLKCVQGARHTAEVLRAAIFWDGTCEGAIEPDLDSKSLSMTIDMLRRQLEVAETLLLRESGPKPSSAPAPVATVRRLASKRGAR